MKNGINTGQFHVKTWFLGNGQRNLISTSVNTETESHKYENRWTKIENETNRNKNIPVLFQPTRIHRPGASELGGFVLRLVGAIPSLSHAPIDSATSGASCVGVGGYFGRTVIARCLLDIRYTTTHWHGLVLESRSQLGLVAYSY